jgi:hypothetical protein
MNGHKLSEVRRWDCEPIQTTLFKILPILSIFLNPLYAPSINAERVLANLVLDVPRDYLRATYVKL